MFFYEYEPIWGWEQGKRKNFLSYVSLDHPNTKNLLMHSVQIFHIRLAEILDTAY